MLLAFVALLMGLDSATSVPRSLDSDSRWIEGTWIATSRNGQIDGRISIQKCSDGTPCGILVWIDPKKNSQRLDLRNPNQRLRSRPLIGAVILSGFTKHGEVWRGGRIYNPEDGMSFNCSIARGGDGQLLVTGCLGPLCQTKTWRRYVND